MKLTFSDLLGLDVTAPAVVVTNEAGSSTQGALVILATDAAAQASANVLADRLMSALGLVRLAAPVRILFGYSILTAPFPLLAGALMTERNTLFDKLSLFAWVEDNAILEPRAEIFGLTPFGEQPVLYLRDLDLDRPVEAWIATEQPTRWLRVAGVLLVDSAYRGSATAYRADDGALVALQAILPPDTQGFVSGLAHEVAAGQSLRVALRRRRKQTDLPLMQICDGWRVLAQAAQFVRIMGPSADSPEGTDGAIADVLRVAAPRKW